MGYNLCSNLRNLGVPFTISLGSGIEFRNYNGSRTFENCHIYNAPFNIPYFTENCANMFDNCYNFNSPLDIEEQTGIVNMAGMFRNCLNFNQDINIPSSCNNWVGAFAGYFQWNTPGYEDPNYDYTCNFHIYAPHTNGYNGWTWQQGYHWVERNAGDYSHGLDGFSRFNGNVVFHHPVENLREFFYGCRRLNRVQHIPRGTMDVSYLFGSCYSFNAPQTFPDTIEDARSIFISCLNLNRRIDLPDNIMANCAFEMCYNLNVAQRLPRNSDLAYFFWSCYFFNQTNYIPYSRYRDLESYRLGRNYRRHNVYGIFYQCENFNSPVTFDSAIEGMEGSIFNGSAFNQPITLPSALRYDEGIFQGAYSFNSTATYPSCTEVMENSFKDCWAYNRPIELPSSLVYMSETFKNCYELDQSIHIPSSVREMGQLFRDCWKLSHMPSYPSHIASVGYLFENCYSLRVSMFNVGPMVNSYDHVAYNTLTVNFNIQCESASTGYVVNVDCAANTFGKTPSGYHWDGNNIVGSGLGDPIGVAYINGDCYYAYNNEMRYKDLNQGPTHFIHSSSPSSLHYHFIDALSYRNTYNNLPIANRTNRANAQMNYGRLYLVGDGNWNNSTFLFADFRNASREEDIKFYWYKVVLY